MEFLAKGAVAAGATLTLRWSANGVLDGDLNGILDVKDEIAGGGKQEQGCKDTKVAKAVMPTDQESPTLRVVVLSPFYSLFSNDNIYKDIFLE